MNITTDLMWAQENDELVAEVMATITEAGKLPLLHHPLYVGLPLPMEKDIPDMPGKKSHLPSMERLLCQKRDAWNRAAEERNWRSLFVLCERPYRLHLLCELAQAEWLKMPERCELVMDAWTDCENPHVNQSVWRRFLRQVARNQHQLEWEPEVAVEMEQFAEAVVDGGMRIWRGTTTCEPLDEVGLSWTTCRETADWFAKRWAGMRPGKPCVLSYMLQAEDIKKYIGPVHSRGEYEIIMVERPTFGVGVEVLK